MTFSISEGTHSIPVPIHNIAIAPTPARIPTPQSQADFGRTETIIPASARTPDNGNKKA